ncbi:HPr family phosphocarrier protein [Vibrio nigripulchritudo]|uniref:HPr family phosphocarrier protein n=1 Tax=Vibrio nigripulchritudo TaxID=28173 RepID=UPI0005F9F2C7|nr:HPr family phosphocarrier protein [Vibrio nigripulchritudo]KJY79962.1 phosphate ABC transporter permease [Vibrio nigripulchritudo]
MATECCRTVFIQNRLGLHARAAIKLVELAQSFDADISVSNGEKTVVADSVMGLLMLESSQGQSVTISANGQDAEAALSAVCDLIEHRFDEEE